MGVVVVDDISQRGEAAIVVETSLVGRVHEQPALTYKDASQVHRLVDIIGCPVGLEGINANIRSRVQVPARLSPERLDMAGDALRFAAEELIAAGSSVGVEIDTWLRLG